MAVKERDCFFDNAKFILILLVVIGHIIEPIIYKSTLMKSIYIFVYLFHMPAFILISGYFAKNINTANNTKLISRILIPYLIFQTAYSVFNFYILGKSPFSLDFFNPYWILWFLVSLFTWQLILPYFIKLKYALVISVVLAITAGYMNNVGYYLSISRTITFFPFFLAGFYLKKETFDIISASIKKLYSSCGLVILFVIVYFLSAKIDPSWLYGSYPYSQLGHAQWYAGIFRVLIYISSMLVITLFFSLIPKGKVFFTQMGSRTLYTYLLHGFLAKYLISTGLYSTINSPIEEGLLIIFAAAITLVLSSKFIQMIARPLISPNVNWLFKN